MSNIAPLDADLSNGSNVPIANRRYSSGVYHTPHSSLLLYCWSQKVDSFSCLVIEFVRVSCCTFVSCPINMQSP